MTTLYDRLSEINRALLEEQKKTFPNIISEIEKELTLTPHVLDIKLGTAVRVWDYLGAQRIFNFTDFCNLFKEPIIANQTNLFDEV